MYNAAYHKTSSAPTRRGVYPKRIHQQVNPLDDSELSDLTKQEILYWSKKLQLTPSQLFTLADAELNERLDEAYRKICKENQMQESYIRYKKLETVRSQLERLKGGGGDSPYGRSAWQILKDAAEEIEASYENASRHQRFLGLSNQNLNSPHLYRSAHSYGQLHHPATLRSSGGRENSQNAFPTVSMNNPPAYGYPSTYRAGNTNATYKNSPVHHPTTTYSANKGIPLYPRYDGRSTNLDLKDFRARHRSGSLDSNQNYISNASARTNLEPRYPTAETPPQNWNYSAHPTHLHI